MLEVMGQKMCIINTIRAATDLLDVRSAVYSDRPKMRMIRELMGWEFNVGFQSYGPKYKKSRKLFHYGFNARVSDAYQPIQTKEITLLLEKLLRCPEQFEELLRETTGSIIIIIAFGYQTVKNDEFVRIAEEAQFAMVSTARPGAYLVDFIPLLKYVPEWFPGAHFQHVAREGRELAEDLQNKPYAWARKYFFTSIMETKGLCSDDPVEEEQLIKKAFALMYANELNISGILFLAGADTILASVLNFFLAKKKAQEELSRIVGNDRLPTFADRASLPYIECIVYEGRFIPKGTTMIPNQYTMSHDETIYPDPMAYHPECSMDAPAAKDGGPRNPNTIAFCWGRRIYPGRFLAENSLWLHMATTLAVSVYHLLLGVTVIPPRDYTPGLASRPMPFSCHIRPRNLGVVELIEDRIASMESQ
ncbi:cytochrome P450 [Desarmillaria ectypa]|nr:cytochrome P450 [Desarmillaria ectypa]